MSETIQKAVQREEEPQLTRDEIRAKVFRSKKAEAVQVSLFGANVELRQPTLKEILEAQQTEDRNRAIAMMLVRYCFVPGTNDRVFDEADVNEILQFPFGPDFVKVQEAINRLTGLDLSKAEEELKANPT